MEKARRVFLQLKEAAELKMQIAVLEARAWQKISSAVDDAMRLTVSASKSPQAPVKESVGEDLDRHVNIREACRYLGLSRSSLYRLMVGQRLRYLKLGKTLRFNVRDLRELARKNMIRD